LNTQPKYKRLLIIRLSAMGDVAMTVPVIKTFTEQFPDVEIALLTRKAFNPLFITIPKLTIINPDLKGRHKGVFGLYKLFKSLKKDFNPDAVIDLHDVLRSKVLRFFFSGTLTKYFKIDKGRKEKRELIRKENKILKTLMHSTQRYADCFIRAGFNFNFPYPCEESSSKPIKSHSGIVKIGIAPFAKHAQKQYPLELMKQVIKQLILSGREIYIFGGGESEQKQAEELEMEFPGVKSLIGKYTLAEELEFVAKMDVMITMDSANMHMAALTDTKIVSIWGATHPFTGFSPYAPETNIVMIQNDQLDCRPCSVFGNRPCFKENLECMYSVKPENIVEVCQQGIKKG
jgi:ADP-heptose:LPS heptosyltransferase